MVKLVGTKGAVTDREKSIKVAVNLADYVIIRGVAYFKYASNSSGNCSEYHLICAKDGTATMTVPADDHTDSLNVSFDGTTVMIDETSNYPIKFTVEAYKYQ